MIALKPPSGFQLLRLLGAGTSGTVYLAMDRTLVREVAVKCVPRLSRSASDLARIVEEGSALAQISHPQCARVLDVQLTSDAIWLVMDYIPGSTLQARFDQGPPMAWQEALRYVRDLAGVLSCLADSGLAHHDVKPANVIVNDTRGACLVDFGACTKSDTGPTEIGTAAFMAPERLGPHPQVSPSAGTRADVYALGVVAYWAFIGEHPFASLMQDCEAMGRAHQFASPEWPKRTVPLELRRAIASTLRKNPRRRVSAAQFRRKLDRA
jgi:serine/threonine protein kinase